MNNWLYDEIKALEAIVTTLKVNILGFAPVFRYVTSFNEGDRRFGFSPTI